MSKTHQTPGPKGGQRDTTQTPSTATKGPMWKPLEFLAVKKAAHETSTMQGLVKGAALTSQTAENYRRHLILLDKEGGDTKWVDVPWTTKGKGVVFTLNDSLATRPLINLWKLSGRIDRDIKRVHLPAWVGFLTEDGEIPSGKNL